MTIERRLDGERDARFRTTFEHAAIGIAHVAADGRWLEANPQMCEIVGYTPNELSSLTFRDLTHPEDLDDDLECIRRVLSDRMRAYSLKKRYVRKDGTPVWIDLTSSLVRDRAGEPKYFIKIVRPISPQRGPEDQASANARRVISALPRSMRSDMALPANPDAPAIPSDSVAHDLNNLLFVILCYADLAMSGLAPSSALGQDLGEIRRAALRAHDLTRYLVRECGN
jgi:PAS domain S-box-containing protein